jgi:hypothetical protein
MNLQEHIRRVLKEEVTDRGEKFRDLSKKVGLRSAIKFAGDVNNFIKIAYNGDIKEYFKHEKVEPYSIKVGDNVNMYLNDLLVQHLNLKDFDSEEKELGDFRFGKKNSQSYKFTARLRKVKYVNGDVSWKVVGMCGSQGFGYSFMNKRDELAKTYRKQIFQQIIDKYNLDSYK